MAPSGWRPRSGVWVTRPRSCPAASPSSAASCNARLGIDYLHANELDIVDGVVTGEVRTEIVDGARKAHYLDGDRAAEGLSMEQ